MSVDFGNCKEHSRPFEGLCKGCEVIICPSCVMFGKHKKHDVLSLKQGAMYIRRAIDNAMQKGLLKKEFTESKVLSIRENGLIVEKTRTDTVREIEEKFKKIAKTLKERRDFLINEINIKFEMQKQKIDEAESDWCCKEDVSKKLSQLLEDKNDALLLANSKFILDGLRKITEKVDFCELEIYNNIDTNLVVDYPPRITRDEDTKENKSCSKYESTESALNEGVKKVYSLEDIVKAIDGYMKISPPKVLSYKA